MSSGSGASGKPINMAGAVFAQRAAAGTTNLVTAVANVNGIYIPRGKTHATASGSEASILVGGLPLANSYIATPVDVIENFFIPAGVALDINCVGAGAASVVNIWYRVL